MMKNNFYPITIIKKDNLFIASIAELGISVSGKNHADTVEECIAQKNKILKQELTKLNVKSADKAA